MINRVILVGNLGKDPEVRRLENGTAAAKFSIATSESYQDKQSGEWQESTEWHEIIAWRNRAEQAERVFKKGMTVYIEGKLTHRKYTDANNIERYRTEVVANYMRKIKDPGNSGNSGNDSNYFPSENTATAATPVAQTAAGGSDSPADDLPFPPRG